MSTYYDRNGNPLTDLMEWATLLNDPEYKRVAWDELPAGGHLSTVWMGIDHEFFGRGPPIIFETMAFPVEQYDIQERYATLEDARAGHARILAELKAPKE